MRLSRSSSGGSTKSRSSSMGTKKPSLLGRLFSGKSSKEDKEVSKAFKAHANGAGLNVDGLRQAIVMTGTEPPGFDELPALLSQHDADSDGRITLEEFKALTDEDVAEEGEPEAAAGPDVEEI